MIPGHRVAVSGLPGLAAILVLFGLIAPGDAVAQGRIPVPDDIVLVQLVRATISALNQANFTGNYTVLRDLGAPSFRNANTATRLADLFSNLRNQNLDLGPLLVVDPVFTEPSRITNRGMLSLDGYFPTRPRRVTFGFLFEAVAGRWRLFGMTVNTEPAPKASAAPTEPDFAPAATAAAPIQPIPAPAAVANAAPTEPDSAPAATAAAPTQPIPALAGLGTVPPGPDFDWRRDLVTGP